MIIIFALQTIYNLNSVNEIACFYWVDLNIKELGIKSNCH